MLKRDSFLDLQEFLTLKEKKNNWKRILFEVFDEEAGKLTDVEFLAQGTIYPDVIESMSVKGPSMTIKSHHNVGGLPEDMKFKLLEPLRLFKDEVRKVGRELGIPDHIDRQTSIPRTWTRNQNPW